MKMNDDCKKLNDYLESAYTGARMFDDFEAMERIARAIEAFNLDVHKDCVIKNIGGELK
jgi:hypothetical protein